MSNLSNWVGRWWSRGGKSQLGAGGSSRVQQQLVDVKDLPPPPAGHSLIVEGQAAIPFSEGNEVFYNKVQVFNRDLTIHVIKYFAEVRLQEKREMEIRKATQGGRRREKKRRQQEEVEGQQQPLAEEDQLREAALQEKLAELRKVNWTEELAKADPSRGIKILDALAATALRSVRYAKEIPGVQRIVANDIDPAAVAAAQRNIAYNKVPPELLIAQQGDANAAMFSSGASGDPFDVIDLDPYGSAAPFVDAAVRSVAPGGLLCVTCTDMAVLSGSNASVCYSMYGSMPTKGRYLHEMALRILLHTLESCATRYKRTIEPILSLSIDFYIRVFVRVHEKAQVASTSCERRALVLQSQGCGHFSLLPISRIAGRGKLKAGLLRTDPTDSGNGGDEGCEKTPVDKCPITGSAMRVGGPIWSDPIHNMGWVGTLLRRAETLLNAPGRPATIKRIHGMLTSVSEELPDVPLYYSLPDLCSSLHCSSPRLEAFRAAIVNAGYRVSASHREASAIKTDAPSDFLWDILRAWVKEHPVSEHRKQPGSVTAKILAVEPRNKIDFDVPSALRARVKAVRYQMNPEAYWGPKKRATGAVGSTGGKETAARNAAGGARKKSRK